MEMGGGGIEIEILDGEAKKGGDSSGQYRAQGGQTGNGHSGFENGT